MVHRGWFSVQCQVLKEIPGQRWPRDEILHRFGAAVKGSPRHNALDPFVPFGFHSYTLPFILPTMLPSPSLDPRGSYYTIRQSSARFIFLADPA
jgi:hypothetical protein